jgi:HD-like signal output (HDOD) protein
MKRNVAISLMTALIAAVPALANSPYYSSTRRVR